MVSNLYAEINIFCIILLAVFFYKIESNAYMKRKHHLLSVVILVLILLFVFDMTWALLDGGVFDSGIVLNYFANMGYFITTAIAAFIYYIYCFHIQQSVIIKNKNILALSALPCLALVIIAISSPINHILFFIDKNNVYQRGPYSFVCSAIVYVYFLSTTVISLINASKKENIALRNLYLSFGFFSILPIAGVLLQLVFPGYPMISVSMTLGVFIIYLQILDSQVVVDRLTLLYNRNWFYRNNSLNPITNALGAPERNFLMILDIDGLKLINDSYGYPEGDDILNLVARVLSSLDKSANGMGDFTAIRYGEDEFLVICELNESTVMDNVTDYVNSEISRYCAEQHKQYKLSVSLGYTPYPSNNNDIDAIVNAADANMFNNKKMKRYS